MGRDRERSVRRLFERLRVPMTKRSRGAYFVTEAQYAELIEKMTTCSRSGVEAKTSISVARSVSGANIIKEHSCGTDRRDDAEAYRSKLEAEIRHEILYGSRGRTHTLTIADALLAYVKRPGGLRSYDLARIDEINRLVGDFTIAVRIPSPAPLKSSTSRSPDFWEVRSRLTLPPEVPARREEAQWPVPMRAPIGAVAARRDRIVSDPIA